MSNKNIVRILEALSKAADVDLEFTDENPELEDNFSTVKDSGKSEMPKEKFDKAGGAGTPKKMNTDPKIDKVSDGGVKGGAQQKDSKTLKKEAYLIKMIQEMTGKKVTLKEYYDEPEVAPVPAQPAKATNQVTREELQKRKDTDKKYIQLSINSLRKIIGQEESNAQAGLNQNNSTSHANSVISRYERSLKEDTPLENYLEPGEELAQTPELDEASRAERIARGKGTGNLKV